MGIKEFEQKRVQIELKYEVMQRYKKKSFLCSISLSKLYKELYTKIESGELNGISLPSPDVDNIKSLLYTADGTCTSFRISIDNDRNLYTKYDIKAISVIIPQDATSNQECSLDDLPRVIEIALIGKDSDSLTYTHPHCPDVLLFWNCDELVSSINELVNYEQVWGLLLQPIKSSPMLSGM